MRGKAAEGARSAAGDAAELANRRACSTGSSLASQCVPLVAHAAHTSLHAMDELQLPDDPSALWAPDGEHPGLRCEAWVDYSDRDVAEIGDVAESERPRVQLAATAGGSLPQAWPWPSRRPTRSPRACSCRAHGR